MHLQETVFLHKKTPSNAYRRRVVAPLNGWLTACDEAHANLVTAHHTATAKEIGALARTPLDGRLRTAVLERADARAQIQALKTELPLLKVALVHSRECPNLRSTLKLIVNRLLEGVESNNADRRLTYDLGILSRPPFKDSAQHFVVVLEDTESFGFDLVRELVEHLQTYADELPLVLVLNLQLPPALLAQHLTSSIIMGLNAKVLPGAPGADQFVNSVTLALETVGAPKLSLELQTALLKCPSCASAAKHLRLALLAYSCGNGTGEVKAGPLQPFLNPNYRPLIEQALADASVHSPNCDRLSVPASVLYQLARESSIYINLYDFFQAFRSLLKPLKNESTNDLESQRQSMALFLLGVSELKHIGVLRDCKRKFECVEKAAFKGV